MIVLCMRCGADADACRCRKPRAPTPSVEPVTNLTRVAIIAARIAVTAGRRAVTGRDIREARAIALSEVDA